MLCLDNSLHSYFLKRAFVFPGGGGPHIKQMENMVVRQGSSYTNHKENRYYNNVTWAYRSIKAESMFGHKYIVNIMISINSTTLTVHSIQSKLRHPRSISGLHLQHFQCFRVVKGGRVSLINNDPTVRVIFFHFKRHVIFFDAFRILVC